MSSTAVVVIVLVLLVAVVLGVVLARRKRSAQLQEHFGPEYERSVSAASGDRRAAEAALAERRQRREEFDVRDLRPEERSRFRDSWNEIQRGFVDNPKQSLHSADLLVAEVMRTRGYPVDDDFDRRADDLSVDHPRVVQHYREARRVRDSEGEVDTEQQRTAVTSYRSLIDALLGDEDGHGAERGAERTADRGTDRVADDRAVDDRADAVPTVSRPTAPPRTRGPAPAGTRCGTRRRTRRRPARPPVHRPERGPEPPHDRGAHPMTMSDPQADRRDDDSRGHRSIGQRIRDAVLGDPADDRPDAPVDAERREGAYADPRTSGEPGVDPGAHAGYSDVSHGGTSGAPGYTESGHGAEEGAGGYVATDTTAGHADTDPDRTSVDRGYADRTGTDRADTDRGYAGSADADRGGADRRIRRPHRHRPRLRRKRRHRPRGRRRRRAPTPGTPERPTAPAPTAGTPERPTAPAPTASTPRTSRRCASTRRAASSCRVAPFPIPCATTSPRTAPHERPMTGARSPVATCPPRPTPATTTAPGGARACTPTPGATPAPGPTPPPATATS